MKKILSVLVIFIGIIALSLSSYFIFKNLNNSNNEIKDKEQLKDNTYDNNFPETDTNDKQIKGDEKQNNKANTNNDNNDKKEEIVNKNIPSKYELKSLRDLQYYLYTPSNPTSGMPLIMYLHGGTNKKLDVQAL